MYEITEKNQRIIETLDRYLERTGQNMIEVNEAAKRLKRGLGPIVDGGSRFLILGTLPGEESLRKQEYYSNPSNRFWTIIASLIGEPVPATYDAKKNLLIKYRIALWDVLKEAERKGSMDVDLQNTIANDIAGLLKQFPNISVIGLNGGSAKKLFQKYIVPQQLPGHIKIVALRSTSPANRQFSIEYMLENWRQIFD